MINKIYKSVLITGASSGIGLETLKRFLKENLKVYALDKDVSILEKLKKKHKFEIIQIDLFDTDQIYKTFNKGKYFLINFILYQDMLKKKILFYIKKRGLIRRHNHLFWRRKYL